jgi:RNA polymerase sigma-70 factor (ECF subfamily)
MPDERVTGRETLAVIGRAIEALPPMQAEVIRLRDVLGWTSDEVRNALDLTDTNQRVLLHRARAKVRAVVEEYLRSVNT